MGVNARIVQFHFFLEKLKKIYWVFSNLPIKIFEINKIFEIPLLYQQIESSYLLYAHVCVSQQKAGMWARVLLNKFSENNNNRGPDFKYMLQQFLTRFTCTTVE